MTDAQKVYDLMKEFCQLERGNPRRPDILLEVKHIIDFPAVDKPDGFDAFWSAYPHKVAKGSAEKAWPKARKDAPLEVILSGVEWYKRNKPDEISWAHPASWLNAKRWLDGQYVPPKEFQRVWPEWKERLAAHIGVVQVNTWFDTAQYEQGIIIVPDPVKRSWITSRYNQALKLAGIQGVI